MNRFEMNLEKISDVQKRIFLQKIIDKEEEPVFKKLSL